MQQTEPFLAQDLQPHEGNSLENHFPMEIAQGMSAKYL